MSMDSQVYVHVHVCPPNGCLLLCEQPGIVYLPKTLRKESCDAEIIPCSSHQWKTETPPAIVLQVVCESEPQLWNNTRRYSTHRRLRHLGIPTRQFCPKPCTKCLSHSTHPIAAWTRGRRSPVISGRHPTQHNTIEQRL